MSQQASDGMRYLAGLQLGVPELSWLQSEYGSRGQTSRLASAFEPGWIGSWWGDGSPAFGWELYDNANVLSTRAPSTTPTPHLLRKTTVPFLGVDPFGSVIEVSPSGPMLDGAGVPVTVPSDDTWYTLVATYLLDKREPGTLNLTAGSTTVTGTGTHFTRYASAADPRPMRARVDATDTVSGNAGTYAFATITDDTNATLASAPPATETGVYFRIRGDFLGSVPADPDCHWNGRVAWDVRARTVTPPSDGIVAYDVMRTSLGVFSSIDRRHAQVFRPMDGRIRAYSPLFTTTLVDITGGVGFWTNPQITTVYAVGVTEEVHEIAVAGCSDGAYTPQGLNSPTAVMVGMLVTDSGVGNDRFVIKVGIPWQNEQAPISTGSRWHNPQGTGSEVDVATAANLLSIGLVAVPAASGHTHLAFYTDSTGNLQMKTSATNGQTWVGPTEIWTPPTTDVLAEGLSVILTRMGRVVVVAAYQETSGSGDIELRWIYSDDYGTTWNTNAQVGQTLLAVAGVDFTFPKAAEDDDGIIWTAAVQDGTIGVLVRGGAVNSPTPAAEVPATGWQIGDANYDVRNVGLVAAPTGGSVVAFYAGATAGSGANQFIGAAAVSHGRTLNDTKYVQTYAGVGTGLKSALCPWILHNGQCWVVALNLDAGEVRAYQCELIPTERPHSFRGGY